MVRVHPTATMISKIDTVDDREFTEIITSSRMWKEIGRKFGYQKNLSSNLRKKVRQRCEQLGLDYLEPKKTLAVSKRTKGELFANRRNWQSYIIDQLTALLACGVVLVLMLLNIITFPYYAMGVQVFTILMFVGTMILGDRKAREELVRRFHW